VNVHVDVVRPVFGVAHCNVAAVPRPRRATMRSMHAAEPDANATEAAAAALERAASGDQAAFAEFYDAISPVVFGTTFKVLRNHAMAEEVTQEVFLELWRQAPRYERSKGSPRAWAATIAHRRAVDRVRSEQSARARDEADARRVPVTHDAVAEQVAGILDRQDVSDAFAQLSERQREAVGLAYFGGHTYREVAALLDVPEGTIKTRIRDGLIRLRDLMGVTP
jgi:RNA polymerase sigma-70 factor, ECF subfamily